MRLIQVGLCLLAGASSLPAQGRIKGAIVDSLVTGKPLSGATVIVVGTTISKTTDGRGRFQLDSVPVGKHLLAFFHSALDSIGLGASLVEVDVTHDSESTVTLGTPSGATLKRQLCPASADNTTGLIIGKVRDVDTGAGLRGATVSTFWMELTFDRGPKPVTNRASTESLADGAYVLCGVPLDVPVFLRASVGDQASGPVEAYAESRTVTFRQLAISMTDTTARLSVDSLVEAMPVAIQRRPPGTATLIGRVVDAERRAIRGARVMLHVGGAVAESNASGAFRLTGLPAGSQAIDIRAIGFPPTRRSVDLASTGVSEVTLQLDRRAVPLPTVNVLGNTRLERTGFFQRARQGHGNYLTEQQIARMGGAMAMDVLWYAPGLIPQFYSAQGRTIRGVVMPRRGPGACVPHLFIDGVTYPGAWDQLNFMHKTEIVAVEVYTSTISMPMQFDRGGCGSVVVWTRW